MAPFYNQYNQQRLDTLEILTAFLILVLPVYFLISHPVALPISTREKHRAQFHSSAHIKIFCSMILSVYLLVAVIIKALAVNPKT